MLTFILIYSQLNISVDVLVMHC